jgi:hypothetical protein
MKTESADLIQERAQRVWFPFKRQLQAKLPAEEWNLWVRPMYFHRALEERPGLIHILGALPPNGRIRDAAQKQLQLMRRLLSPHFNISLVHYAGEYEIQEAKKRYEIDIAPKPWRAKSAPQPEANG